MQLTNQDLIEIDKELAKRSLAEFVKMAWHVLEPSVTYIHGWHLDAMCEHLEAVTNGQINRLLTNVPPGAMKSLLSAVFWPAWEWGPKGMPEKRIIGASHEQTLAIRDNLKMKRLVSSDWYQERWPTKLRHDQAAKLNFENDKTGWRQACAVSSMTGKRGDCITGDVLISTDKGDKTMADIYKSGESHNALSFDHNSKRMVYRPIQAMVRRSPNDIYKVHTSRGSVVKCTGDHKIYTKRGYVEARLLSVDDVLLCSMRESIGAQSLPDEEENKRKPRRFSILFSNMCNNTHEYTPRKTRSILQCMWEKNEEKQRPSPMFGGMCRRKQKGKTRIKSNTGYVVRRMRETRKAKNAIVQNKILQPNMRRQSTFKKDVERRKSKMEEWRGCENVSQGKYDCIQPYSEKHIKIGRMEMRSLRLARENMCSSYRRRHSQQRTRKSCELMHELPCGVAQARNTRFEQVALVERLCEKEEVYDIQIEGTRNFFANGILVHNCVLWDDPHSVEAAMSVAHRETALRVFQETLPTRLNSPKDSSIIIIMQRLHEEDVSGYILENDLGYVHLMLPMEYEPERKCYTSIGFEDPRTEDGELLFPERFPQEVVDRDKKVMGSYAWAGQAQQRPAPRGDGFFDWENLETVSGVPKMVSVIRYWDKAGTDGAGAYTAGVKMGKDKDGTFYVLDVVRGQWDAPKRERIIKQTAELDGIETTIWIEQEPGSGGKESAQATKKNLAGFTCKSENPTGAKEVRAEPYSVQIEANNVKILKADWNKAFVDEHKTFPVGKYKDQVDAAAGALNKLSSGKKKKTLSVSGGSQVNSAKVS